MPRRRFKEMFANSSKTPHSEPPTDAQKRADKERADRFAKEFVRDYREALKQLGDE